MRLFGKLADKIALLLIRKQRVGIAHGLGLSNIRDSDGRFYRAAYGAIGLINEHGPHHLRRLRRCFDWIVNQKLCSGEGSTWPEYRLRFCNVSFSDFDDEVATQAFLAATLVEESVRSRFRRFLSLKNEERLLELLERIDRHVILFALELNSARDGLGDIIANSYEKRTATERLSWIFCNDRTQLMFAVEDIRKKRRIAQQAGASDGDGAPNKNRASCAPPDGL
jgi:hypothetical protein